MLASAVAAILILWAPFIGEVRRSIRARFPGQFALIVSAIVIVAIASALALAIARIRDRRATRYAALAAALIFGVAYAAVTRTGIPDVDVVERFHFVEYGLVTWLYYRAWRPLDDVSVFILPALAGVLIGTIDEWFQWVIPARIGEMRDVFLNGAAIGSGLLFSVGVDPPRRFMTALRPGSLGRIGRFAAVTIAGFAAFLHVVHLGYEVRDDRIGSFRSRYTSEDLLTLARDRAGQWRGQFIAVPRRLSREDQYASEGLWHVQWRNRKWDSGDVFAAWRENLILEEFYAPVLDTPSYVSAAGHRWPAEQRTDAESRAMNSLPYVSDAHQYPIYTWPKPIFWSIIAFSIVALLVVSVVRDRSSRP